MSDHRRRHAIHRIRMRRHLWLAGVSWAVAALILVAAWYRSGAPFFWPIWPLAGIGIGLFGHVSHVLTMESPIGERRIAREMERMR